MKISLILMLARTIEHFHKTKKKPTLKDEFILLLQILLIVGIPSILTFLEPDTGAVIIYLIITLLMIFISGIKPIWYILLGIIITILLGSFLYIYFLEEELFIHLFAFLCTLPLRNTFYFLLQILYL